MNIPYGLTLIVTLALATAWLALRAKKRGMKTAPVFTGVLFGTALASVLAKLLYVLLLSGKVWPRHGWASLIRLEAAEFSVIGGALGMVLGMILAAKIHRIQTARMLSLFAPGPSSYSRSQLSCHLPVKEPFSSVTSSQSVYCSTPPMVTSRRYCHFAFP